MQPSMQRIPAGNRTAYTSENGKLSINFPHQESYLPASPKFDQFSVKGANHQLTNQEQILKWIKWILGIALAGIVTLVPANFIMHHTGKVDMNNLTSFQYWIQFLTIPSIAFGLFLFLACAFVPIQKRNAGILVFAMSIVFIVLGTYQHYSDDGFLRNEYLIRYISFIIGLIIGKIFNLLSYKF